MPLLGWLILAFLIALILAAIHGVKSGYRSIRGRYRAKRDLAREFAAAGVAPRAATTGKRVGMAIGATVTGPGVTWRSFLDGVRRGWRVGKRWTEIQRTRRQREREAAADPPAPAVPPPAEPTPAAATPAAPTPSAPSAPATPPAPTPAPPPSTTKGTTTVPIETKTSGELHNKEQFEQELNATIAEATSELEAADADLKAAAEDVGRVDNMVASLARCEIDVATRGDVMTLAGTNSTTQAAHRARVTAAEQRLAAANKALTTFKNAPQTKFHANAS